MQFMDLTNLLHAGCFHIFVVRCFISKLHVIVTLLH